MAWNIQSDHFLPLAIRTLARGNAHEQKETVELLMLYRLLYKVPQSIRAQIIQHIVPLLRSPDRVLRYWSTSALGEFGATESVESLRSAAKDEKDPYVHSWMQASIIHLSARQQDAVRQLVSNDPGTRSISAGVLFLDSSVTARASIAFELEDPDVSALQWKLLALPGPVHRLRRAPLLLGIHNLPANAGPFQSKVIGPPLPVELLKGLLLSGEPRIAEFAIWNFAIARERSVLPIIQAVASPGQQRDAEVREWAYKYLGFVPDTSSIDVLHSAAEVEDDPGAREGIAFALGQNSNPAAVDLLTEMMSGDRQDGVRAWSARACGQLDQFWASVERSLILALEQEESPRVVREIYGALQQNSATGILQRESLLEAHATSPQFQADVISLLLSLATHRGAWEAKGTLTRLLNEVPVDPTSVLQQARAVTESYDLLNRIYPAGTPNDNIGDSYHRGLEYLFQAAVSAHRDVLSMRDCLRKAHASFARAIGAGAASPGPTSSRIDNPTALRCDFYLELCDAYLRLATAVDDRASLRVQHARGAFDDAAGYFNLRSLDEALPPTERYLCSSLHLWCIAQRDVSQLLEVGTDEKACRDAVGLALLVARARAQSALRSRVEDQIRSLGEDITTLPVDELVHRLVDPSSAWNRLPIAVPVVDDVLFPVDQLMTVAVVHNASSRRHLDVTFDFVLGTGASRLAKQRFSVAISVECLGTRVLDRTVIDSREVQSGHARRLLRRLLVEFQGAEIVSDELWATVSLRFPDFEWPMSRRLRIPLRVGHPPDEADRAMERMDVGIVVALDVELHAILSHLENVRIEQDEGVPLTYYRAQVTLPDTEERYEVVTVWLLGKGNTHAAAGAAKLLSRWQPRHIVMLGVAGGIPSRVRRGDVVVGSLSYYYEMAKVYQGGTIEVQPDPLPGDPLLFERARSYCFELKRQGTTWITDMVARRPGGSSKKRPHHDRLTGPLVHFAPIASGEKVLRNTRFRDEVAAQCPGLAAVAMEGAGVARSALLESSRPRFLEIRGIMDFADPRKNDIWKHFAADAAATFLVKFLQSRPVKPG